jgi:hypothetical protein
VKLPVHEQRGVDIIRAAPSPKAGRAGFEARLPHVVANRAVSSGGRRAAKGRALIGPAGRSRSCVDNLEPPDAAFWRKVQQLLRRQAGSAAVFCLEDGSAEQIAESLHCSESIVRVHLHRGWLSPEEQLREGSHV